jgi:hypothetical protein
MSEVVIFEAEDHHAVVHVRRDGNGTARALLQNVSGSVRGIAESSE